MGIQESNSYFFSKTSRESPLQKDTKCSFCDTIFLKNSNYGIFAKHLKICANSNSKLKEQQPNDSTSCGTENDFELIYSCEENEEFYEINPNKTLSFEHKRAELWNKVLEIKASRPSNVKVVEVPNHLSLQTKMDIIESIDIFENILFTINQDKVKDRSIEEVQQSNGEFLNSLLREIINEHKINLIDHHDILYFNHKNKDGVKLIENVLSLIGKIIAKIILDNNNLDIYLNIGIIKPIIEEYITFEDLEKISPIDYNYLKQLQSLSIIEKEIYFTTENSQGDIIELIPKGKEIKVTIDNLKEYISVNSKFIISTYESWVYHLSRSLYEYIPKETITQFTAREFELVLNGFHYIRLNDWKRHTQYHGEFSENHPTIKLLWSFLDEVNQRYLRNSLRVLTDSDDIPFDLTELFSKIKFVISSRPWENQGMQVIRNPGKNILIFSMPEISNINDIKRAFDSFDVKK